MNSSELQTFDSSCIIEEYFRKRNDLENDEIRFCFGGNVELNNKEMLANKIIMEAKEKEMSEGLMNPFEFNPKRHHFEVLEKYSQSEVFQIIKRMPKGGILHLHDLYMHTADDAVSFTYWPNLWQRTLNNSNKIEEFRFSRQQPQNLNDENQSNWRLVKDVREEMGEANYDKHIRPIFTLLDTNVHPKIQYKDINDVWFRFKDVVHKFLPIVTFAPIWKAYHKNGFQEIFNDGVQYFECRGALPKLYDFDGREYDEENAISLFIEALDEFKSENPSFIGAKFIYCVSKRGTDEEIRRNFQVIRRLHKKFPHFIAGFDLSDQEDKAPRLATFAEQILQLPKEIELFFHAGETNWYGSTDQNVIDAVLLGSRRIGHGYALSKHPKVLELIKQNDIAVEVNPISNQVLRLVDDMRNHPAAVLLSQNIPIVISSDNPSLWEVSPLSHDFYHTFLGIASRQSDLKFLKKLASNSIQYSALNVTEKNEAFAKWQVEWDKFIDDLIEQSQ